MCFEELNIYYNNNNKPTGYINRLAPELFF